jgi:hypothetical protein
VTADELQKEINRLVASIAKEDPLGAVIRGHLFVESKIMQLLSLSLHDSGAIDLSRVAFLTKLDLAVAMGVLTETDKRGYARLNALRNQVAHDFEAEIRPSDEKNLYNALNKEQKASADHYSESFVKFSFGILRACLASLCGESLFRVFSLENQKNPPPPAEPAAPPAPAELAAPPPRKD